MDHTPPEAPQGLPTGFGPSGRAGEPPVQRLRLTFTKGRPLRFIGHLDLVRLWERAFRRAQLPLAYTLGYTPHPRLAFAAPLALGATGGAELLDVYLREQLAPEDLVTRLRLQLPVGCAIVEAKEVDLLGPQLMALTRWAEYRVEAIATSPEANDLPDAAPQGSRWAGRAARHSSGPETAPAQEPDDVPWRPEAQRLPAPSPHLPPPPHGEILHRIEALLAATSLPRQRHREGKSLEYDLRPLVQNVWLAPGDPAQGSDDDPSITLGMVLKADSTGSGRPEEVAAALGLVARRIHRVRIGLDGEPPRV